jgi:acyl-CoA synthetase (AMP-forming)/AMP-acid ligase II
VSHQRRRFEPIDCAAMDLHSATIAAFLAKRAQDSTDVLAFAFRNESLTYRQLFDDAERIGGMLLHDGVTAGDRVAIRMEAGLDLIRLFYALQRIGAVPCIFDPHVPETTTVRRIESIAPRATLTSVPLHGASSPLPRLNDDGEAVAFLQLTSGTSGEPLAAVALQRNVMASMRSSHNFIDPSSHDVLVGWVPPWHDLGLLRFLLAPVFFGRPCHLIPPAVRTIPEWLATITKMKGTITGAPDFAWRLATRLVKPADVDLRSIRLATNGGEPVRASTIAAFEQRFNAPLALRPGYGLAEATLGVCGLRPREELLVDERGNVSHGKPLKDVEVRIEDGEIVVRGPAVFAGYLAAPEQTANVLRDGWLYTGDVGTIDDAGDLYVLGRRRAMIKRGGVMLAPREIEEAVQLVPGVRVAAAVGLPSSLTEEIVVVVETDSGVSVESAVVDAVERAVGFAPDRVLVERRHAIPITANGKIRHAVLRDQLMASSERSNPSVSSDGDARR